MQGVHAQTKTTIGSFLPEGYPRESLGKKLDNNLSSEGGRSLFLSSEPGATSNSRYAAMSKLVSPRGRQPTDGLGKDSKKSKSTKLLGWGRSTPKQKEGTKPKSEQPQATRQPRASILLGKDQFTTSPLSPGYKNPDPIPRVSKEERLSILAPHMATTSRHDQEKTDYWKNAGQQQQWRKSVLQFQPREEDYVPPHSKRARGTVSRPLPPASSPPMKPNPTIHARQNSVSARSPLRVPSLGARRENTGGAVERKPVTIFKPRENSSRDASPQTSRITSIHGIEFDERILEDPDFGEATVDLPSLEHSFTLREDDTDPQFDIDDEYEDQAAASYRASLYALEKDITFRDDFQDDATPFGSNSSRRDTDLERDVTFGTDEPGQFTLPDLEREVTFGDIDFVERDPGEIGLMREVTFSTEGGDLSALERDVTFNETNAFVDDFLNNVGDFNFEEFTVPPEPQASPRQRAAFQKELTLGGLKNMAFDIDFDLNLNGLSGFGGSQENSEESRTLSDDPSFDNSESDDDDIEVGPGTEVTLRYKLGKGATATVWCGMVDANIVAIKQITLKNYKEGVDTAKVVVKKEYDIIRSINHPSIIKYHGLFYDKEAEEVNIVMQMITGVLVTDLVLYVEQVPEDIAAFLLQQIIGGFCHLHNVSNVIHRDLKPDNVLLDTHGGIKIIDFGTATSFDPSKEAKRRSTVGTPWYCAPEVLNDEEYTTTCDVWSLGCFALELVTGKPPFDHLNATSCLFQMSQGIPPPVPKTVSDACSSFLHCCLDPDWTMVHPSFTIPPPRPSMQKLAQHPFVVNQPKKNEVKLQIRELIKEMLEVKREKDKSKLKESPTQIADDRLTFNFGPSTQR